VNALAFLEELADLVADRVVQRLSEGRPGWVCSRAAPSLRASVRPVAPAELLQGSDLDTGGAEPSDRGVPQPMWPGVPRVLVAQILEAPPDTTPLPPSAAREICSPWWSRWLRERSAEHQATAESSWFQVGRPRPAASDEWWGRWIARLFSNGGTMRRLVPTPWATSEPFLAPQWRRVAFRRRCF
jgi:hypothetical protein